MRVGIRWLEVRDAAPAVLAADLAVVLESTYGAVGLQASAVGTEIHIDWQGTEELESGFAVATARATP